MAYTAGSGRTQLIAGPVLRTLASEQDANTAFVTPENSGDAQKPLHKPARKTPYITNRGPLLDRWGRIATDLRISLIDKCNLRCIYCMPAEGLEWLPKNNLLTSAEIARLADIAIRELGVEEIRFTGGEPLVRADLVDIIGRIHREHPTIPLAITTNGIGLEKRAQALADAGLSRINVSLDTICPETFAELTRRDKLGSVLKGIDGAAAAGLKPIKINAVLMPGINDAQAPELLRWALDGGYQLRFIEQMPLDADHKWTREGTITAAQIRTMLSEHFVLGTVAEKTRRLPRPALGGLPAGYRPRQCRIPARRCRFAWARGHYCLGHRIILRSVHPHSPDRRRQNPFLPLLGFRNRPARPAAFGCQRPRYCLAVARRYVVQAARSRQRRR